jgi:cell division protein FtsB
MTAREPQLLPQAFLRRHARTILSVLVLALLVHDVFGAHGFLAMRRTQKEIERLRQEIQQVNEENRALADQVKSLKSDPRMIERIAREEMGLARPGELIFKLPAPPANPNGTAKSAAPKK